MRKLNKEKVTQLKNAFALTEQRKALFELRHKRKLMRRLTAFSVAALVVLGTLLSALYTQTRTLNAQKQAVAEAKVELDELAHQQKELEEELIRLQDDDYIAELARKNYFYSKDGEIIFNIPEETDSGQNESE